MSFSFNDPLADKVWFDETNLWILLKDARKISIPLVFFPRLSSAPKEELNKYQISGGGIGIHWEGLDEDLNVPLLVLGIVDNGKILEYA